MKTDPAPRVERPAGKVSFNLNACLRLRPASVPCKHCREVCPTAAFDWQDCGVRITDDCVGCGRCQAACPSGALHVHGFDVGPPASTSVTMPIECHRVPPPQRRTGAAVVPCLGGISLQLLLDWQSAGRVPVLMDRGWCSECRAGGLYASSTRKILDLACAKLHAIQGSHTPVPRIESVPLPSRVAQPLATQPAASTASLGRRAFFASLRQPAATAAALRAPPRLGITRAACAPSPTIRESLQRHAGVLATLARQAGQDLTAATFASLHASTQCTHEGVCASACPSGALALVEGADARVGLDFQAELCVACGLCESLCPHHALTLQPAGDAQALHEPGPRALTRHGLTLCKRCDETFVATNADALCPLCAMAERQAHNLFGALLPSGANGNRSVPF